jgi:hypothetical protein
MPTVSTTRDARQRERRADGTHDAEQNDDVGDERDVRRNAGNPIITNMNSRNENDGPDGRLDAAANRVFAERRVNVAGINDVNGAFSGFCRTFATLLRFFDRVMPGDLPLPVSIAL